LSIIFTDCKAVRLVGCAGVREEKERAGEKENRAGNHPVLISKRHIRKRAHEKRR